MDPENTQSNIVANSPSQLETTQTSPSLSPDIEEALIRYEGMRKEFQDLKKDYITVFGIFASFVTFLSVEIQIFKTVTNFWLLLGLSSFLLAGILVFSFAISSVSRGKPEWRDLNNPISMFIGIFLVITILCFVTYNLSLRSEGYQIIESF